MGGKFWGKLRWFIFLNKIQMLNFKKSKWLILFGLIAIAGLLSLTDYVVRGPISQYFLGEVLLSDTLQFFDNQSAISPPQGRIQIDNIPNLVSPIVVNPFNNPFNPEVTVYFEPYPIGKENKERVKYGDISVITTTNTGRKISVKLLSNSLLCQADDPNLGNNCHLTGSVSLDPQEGVSSVAVWGNVYSFTANANGDIVPQEITTTTKHSVRRILSFDV
jgi:hypothetical protein